MTTTHPPQMKVGPDRKYLGKTYSEWLLSLTANDPVRIRHPWQDGSEPGGRIDKGYVVETHDGSTASWRVAVRFHDAMRGKTETIAFNEEGRASYCSLEHPDVRAGMAPDGRADQGMEFLTGIEMLAITAQHENRRAVAAPTTPVEPQNVPLDYANPDWKSREQKYEWKTYISKPLREIWDSFTLLQKAVIASSAEEAASNEDWERLERD
jgi:hypothetical protein